MPAIKASVYGSSSDQPIYDIETMRQIASESMSPQRFPMVLLGTFSGLALVLAAVGVYAMISYSMTQRVREIGIRIALGAEKQDVFRMVIGQGLRLTLGGLCVGAVVAFLLGRLLSGFSRLLYGVGAGGSGHICGGHPAVDGRGCFGLLCSSTAGSPAGPDSRIKTGLMFAFSSHLLV